MHSLVIDSREDFAKVIEHLKGDLQSIRGNRAHPSLVEEVSVAVYGSEMRLKEVATITVPEPRMIQIQAWDKSVLKDIERSLGKAELSVGIKNDGEVLRLSLPPLTSETRSSLLKVLGQKLEAGRVQLRQVREKVREQITKAERAKELTEDDRYSAQQDLDDMTKEFLAEIETLGERKETEISTI